MTGFAHTSMKHLMKDLAFQITSCTLTFSNPVKSKL